MRMQDVPTSNICTPRNSACAYVTCMHHGYRHAHSCIYTSYVHVDKARHPGPWMTQYSASFKPLMLKVLEIDSRGIYIHWSCNTHRLCTCMSIYIFTKTLMSVQTQELPQRSRQKTAGAASCRGHDVQTSAAQREFSNRTHEF